MTFAVSHDCITKVQEFDIRKSGSIIKISQGSFVVCPTTQGAGRENKLFSPLPPPPRFCPNAHPKGCNFYTRLSSVVVKSKIATAALQVEATFAHLKIFLRTKHFCASGFSKA